MANDNRIDLIARVDVEESAQQIIKEDLPNLQTKINEKGGIKIDCSIDTKNFDVLRKQISEFSKGLKIDVSGLNIGSNKFGLDIAPTREEIRQLEKDLDLVFNKRKTNKPADDLRREFASLIDDYKDSFTKALDSGDFTKTNNAYQKLIDFAITYRREIDTTNEALAEQKNLIKSITASTLADGQKATTYIDSRLKAELDSMTGGIAGDNKKILDNVFGVGGWTYDRSKSFNTFDSVAEELRSIPSLQNLDSNYIEAFRQVIGLLNGSLSETNDMIELIERETEGELYTTLGNFLNNMLLPIVEAHNNLTESKDTPEFVSEDTIKNLDIVENKLETIVATEKEAQELMNTKTDVNMEYPSLLSSKNTKETLENAKRQLNELEIPATRITRAIEDSTGQLIAFDVQVEKEDKSIEKLRYRLNEAGDGFEYLYKTIREADNATDLRKKPIEVSVGIKTSELDTFIKKVEDSGVPIEKFTYSVDDLKKSLSDVGNVDIGFDAGKFNAFQDKFAIAKAEFKGLQNEMRIASKDQSFENRLKKLSAQMQVFENANEKAVTSLKKMSDGKTFAQGWEDLKESLNTSNLNADGLKHINEQLATFKAEANSAGLTSSSFFKNMGEQIKGVVTQYVSLTFAISKIGNAINELKSIDDILTEISKTSDRTTESLQRLGETSFDRANQFGRKASDYLYGVQEMSRAGFGEMQSENLAELSILAQSAGDLTTELANDYIIATNAAYKFNGNIEKLNATLDSQNYITNNNALSMEDLASATRLAASQAANAGIGIDELTAATGTMIATTRESGDVAARAFRGIIMNLQQTKATAEEIGDGGLDITTESLTKYEKAVQDLGVSIKEVKNGVTQLRNPMEILRDLSIAVSKESEGSIKVANLISSVGGKYRGNQLIALLENWSTYEKMLSEFNSEGAIGSSMSEATKSANNWSGSLNQLSNSWTEFVSKIVNSEDAIQTIRTLNNLIQNASDSGSAEALGRITKTIADLLSAIGTITGKIGTIPTLLGVGATVKGLGELPNMPTYVLIQ